MGGEGSMMAANQSLKSNRKLLAKRERFKNNLGGYGKNSKPEFNLPKATPEVLDKIKKRLNKERQQMIIKTSVLVTLIFTGCVIFFLLIT